MISMKMVNKVVQKIFTIAKESILVTKNFGMNYGSQYFWTSIFRKNKYLTRKHGIEILEKEYSYLFDEVDLSNDKISFDQTQRNIFLYWAQGFSNLPEFQQEVLCRIKRFYNDYNIVLVSDSNYSNYVCLDEKIISLYRNKKITVQTFSDILRFNLVYKYGGVWCDMTNLFFKRIEFDHCIEKYGFWSINHDSYAKESIWGKVYPVTYVTFLFATFKENDIMKICVDFYNEYYKTHDFCIDYFMNDFILIMCMKNKVCNDMLNKIPYTTSSPFLISEFLSGKRDVSIDELRICPQKVNNKTLKWDVLKEKLQQLEV